MQTTADRSYDFLAEAFDAARAQDAAPIKMWTRGVPVDEASKQQLLDTARMPFIYKWLAVMPDVHYGKGSTIGSVIPTKGAIIPAAVGVDLGCGMMAARTSLSAADLPDNLAGLRAELEKAVPHGRSVGHDKRDTGAWSELPEATAQAWSALEAGFTRIVDKHQKLAKANTANHLGTLGTGNHFIELCLDQEDRVWLMLHSGSRGVGNAIGSYFIERAREEMRRYFINLPDKDLAYLPEGTQGFDDYVEAVDWAQSFAMANREVMMRHAVEAAHKVIAKPFEARLEAVNCHHNYVAREHHFGENVLVTRKGAVRAAAGVMGIIPGSMGAKSFIVRGKGNVESFCSCSHGAGRVMSRAEAKRRFTVEDHVAATAGVECRKDADVIDETPKAYKDIDAVMAAQADLVEIVHTLRQLVCVKG
ncbi:RtcB family protein [Methylosinus sp. Sm6]|uniref:RtcB family protein n=1 Tax=Methylosinus sp. Sm6 TaxID=2866948 RepID=UPI001C995714|nr:RtcB family protein [Methylosinus sp. Sm6]MBY6241834.1 RtcB family protein [Methylosinus sp. Sm6]